MEDQKPNWNGFLFTSLPSGFKSSVCDVHNILLHEDNKFSAAGLLNFAYKTCPVFSNPVKLKFHVCLNPESGSD